MIRAKWYVGGGIEDAHEIRRRVFIEEQGVAFEEEMDGTDIEAIHLVAYEGDKPVATGRLRLVKGVAEIGRMAVLKEERGKGYGDFVLRVLIRKALDMNYEKQVVHAQRQAEGFYARLGFAAVGEPFDEAGIAHIMMEREGDLESCGA